jgi:hypothetical protein
MPRIADERDRLPEEEQPDASKMRTRGARRSVTSTGQSYPRRRA